MPASLPCACWICWRRAVRLLEYVDVLVDGPYVEALRDPSLHFRGSANQRLVDLRRSVPGELVFYDK